MVKIMENPIKMDDLGGPPLFLETPIWENIWDGILFPFASKNKQIQAKIKKVDTFRRQETKEFLVSVVERQKGRLQGN